MHFISYELLLLVIFITVIIIMVINNNFITSISIIIALINTHASRTFIIFVIHFLIFVLLSLLSSY